MSSLPKSKTSNLNEMIYDSNHLLLSALIIYLVLIGDIYNC